MIKPRIVVLAVTISLMLVTLISCSQAPEIEKIEITLMHGWGGPSPNHVSMRKIYEDFELKNPDVKLNFDASPDLAVVIDKANDKLAAGKMPDIISTNGAGRFLSNAIIRGRALDLKPYIDADDSFREDIHPSILNAWMKDDHIYTLPDALEIIGYWYNEDILQKAGVTVDSLPGSAVKLPVTWEEFWEACRKIADWSRSSSSVIMPMMLEEDQSLVYLGARIAGESERGAALISNAALTLESQEFQIAIDELRKARDYGYYKTISRNDALQLFKQSETAFFFGGVWDSDELSSSEHVAAIKYAVFPAFNGHTVSYVSPSSGYVIGNTGDPRKIEASVRFLKYMLSEEVQKRIVLETNQAPSNPHLDINWIKQNAAMLGQALETASRADIQIRTLDSLNDESTAAALKRKLQQAIKQ